MLTAYLNKTCSQLKLEYLYTYNGTKNANTESFEGSLTIVKVMGRDQYWPLSLLCSYLIKDV